MIFFLNTVNTNGPFVRKVIISSSVMVVISIQAEYSHTQITDRTATQCCIYLKIKQALFLLIGLCHQIIPGKIYDTILSFKTQNTTVHGIIKLGLK